MAVSLLTRDFWLSRYSGYVEGFPFYLTTCSQTLGTAYQFSRLTGYYKGFPFYLTDQCPEGGLRPSRLSGYYKGFPFYLAQEPCCPVTPSSGPTSGPPSSGAVTSSGGTGCNAMKGVENLHVTFFGCTGIYAFLNGNTYTLPLVSPSPLTWQVQITNGGSNYMCVTVVCNPSTGGGSDFLAAVVELPDCSSTNFETEYQENNSDPYPPVFIPLSFDYFGIFSWHGAITN